MPDLEKESGSLNRCLSPSGDRELLAKSAFMKACRRERTDYVPVWLMRQAGRFMPEFREIRSRVGFLELCKNSELSCEVTVMAREQLNVDAAIIFADILLPIEPLGAGLEYVKGEGPVIHRPVRSAEQVRSLAEFEPREALGYVMNSIALTRRALPAHIPLIGFAGAPFTMASYLVEGGASRHFEHTKSFMYRQPEAWSEMMNKLSAMTASYLLAQIEAGAQAIQLFDSWVGCLSPADYQRFVLPYSRRALQDIPADVPVIHFGTGTGNLIKLMKQAGGSVIGLDWRVSLDESWSSLGDVAVQGNLDPTVLLADKDEIKRQVSRILKESAGRPGHIFNLGHGVLPMTDVDHVKYLVELVHQLGGK